MLRGAHWESPPGMVICWATEKAWSTQAWRGGGALYLAAPGPRLGDLGQVVGHPRAVAERVRGVVRAIAGVRQRQVDCAARVKITPYQQPFNRWH